MSVSVPLRLRPLEIGDMLDETFRMYRRHFLLFAGISLLLAVPSAALYGLAFAWVVALGVLAGMGCGVAAVVVPLALGAEALRRMEF